MCRKVIIRHRYCDHDHSHKTERCARYRLKENNQRINNQRWNQQQPKPKNRGCLAMLWGSSEPTPHPRGPIGHILCTVGEEHLFDDSLCPKCIKIIRNPSQTAVAKAASNEVTAKMYAYLERQKNKHRQDAYDELTANGQGPRLGRHRAETVDGSSMPNLPPPALSKNPRGRTPRSRFDVNPGPAPSWPLPPNPPKFQPGAPVDNSKHLPVMPQAYAGPSLTKSFFTKAPEPARPSLNTANVKHANATAEKGKTGHRTKDWAKTTNAETYTRPRAESDPRGRTTERPPRKNNGPPVSYRSPSRKRSGRSRSSSRSRSDRSDSGKSSSSSSSKRRAPPAALALNAYTKEFVDPRDKGAAPNSVLTAPHHTTTFAARARSNSIATAKPNIASKKHEHPKFARAVPLCEEYIAMTPKFDSGRSKTPGLPKYAKPTTEDMLKSRVEPKKGRMSEIKQGAKKLVHQASDESFVCADAKRVEKR